MYYKSSPPKEFPTDDLPFVFMENVVLSIHFQENKGSYCSENTIHHGPSAYISDEGYKFSNQ
jgi:hypothetical protein